MKVLKQIGENAYKIELLAHLDISNTFNVANIAPYFSNDSTYDSRTSPFPPGENNRWVSSNGPIDIGLFEFGLAMQVIEVLDDVHYQPMGQLLA